jgi:hypothetical protein
MSSTTWFDRPTLTGRYVRLEPLSAEHTEGLFEAGRDPRVWTWPSKRRPADVSGMRALVDGMLAAHRGGAQVPGARRDGLLRDHRIMPDGSVRHTVVYSMVEREWPAARDALRARLTV